MWQQGWVRVAGSKARQGDWEEADQTAQQPDGALLRQLARRSCSLAPCLNLDQLLLSCLIHTHIRERK